MEKKTISAGIIGAGGFIGQEHLERLIHEIDMEIYAKMARSVCRCPQNRSSVRVSRLTTRL